MSTLLAAASIIAPASRLAAHGFAGERFFPATLSTDDPFVADEMSLPTLASIRTPDNNGTRELDVSVDISKRLTPNLDIELSETLISLWPSEGSSQTGLDNLSLGAKYQAYENDAHEFILSFGLDVDAGGTGAKRVGAESFSTFTPGIFFGKGFGDLTGAAVLRPLAITGLAGFAIPTRAATRISSIDPVSGKRVTESEHEPVNLEWGFALEYSLIYLQEHVRDVGLPAPFNRMVPLVEFSLETPLNRGQGGQTTGTINPGVIWSGKYNQFGIEAVIPVNSRTGNNVGVIAQMHFYLDDLFPHSLGRPVFGGMP